MTWHFILPEIPIRIVGLNLNHKFRIQPYMVIPFVSKRFLEMIIYAFVDEPLIPDPSPIAISDGVNKIDSIPSTSRFVE